MLNTLVLLSGFLGQRKIMPVVEITFFEGRSLEKKRRLVRAVTDALVNTIDVKAEWVNVILHEVRKDQWAISGSLESDKP